MTSSSFSSPLTFFPHVAVIATCVKLLTLPSYKSTDFDVHRNWLSVTHSRRLDQWYTEDTNPWTLDYPPLFAYFEYALSLVAVRVDPEMVRVRSDAYRSPGTLYFQCLSVIVSDFVFYFAVYRILSFLQSDSSSSQSFRSKMAIYDIRCQEVESETADWFQPRFLLTMLLVFSPGLLIVDHLHFQYNGFLSGLFLLSILCMMQEHFVPAAVLFSVLLHFKHMYLYVAPAVFVLMLRRHCFDRHFNFKVRNFAHLALSVTGVTVVSLARFVHQLPQLKERLFPFKRGLTHAYWAPNVWAVYNAVDWILAKALGLRGTPPYTTGLVQDFDHMVLPSIGPGFTFLLTMGVMAPSLVHLWRSLWFTAEPQVLFLRVLTLCSLSSFLCSWHVHEKAILMSLLPMTLLTLVSPEEARNWLLMASAGSVSLFPLLLHSQETGVKILLTSAYFAYAVPGLAFYWKRVTGPEEGLLSRWERTYMAGFVGLQVLVSVAMPVLGVETRLPFAPLALTSLYCFPGILLPFIRLYRDTLVMK